MKARPGHRMASFIACSSTRGGNAAIYVVNVKTGAATRVTNMAGNQTQPAWAPGK